MKAVKLTGTIRPFFSRMMSQRSGAQPDPARIILVSWSPKQRDEDESQAGSHNVHNSPL